jgi:hypothetical protein
VQFANNLQPNIGGFKKNYGSHEFANYVRNCDVSWVFLTYNNKRCDIGVGINTMLVAFSRQQESTTVSFVISVL